MKRRFQRSLTAWALTALIWGGVLEPGLHVLAADPSAESKDAYEILEVYLKTEEALELLFPDAESFVSEEAVLDPDQAVRVAEEAGHPLLTQRFTVHRALKGGDTQGYALVSEEIGKFHFITFMVGVQPDGRVKRVEVLVYRESRGGEVRNRRFLRQYEGKSLDSAIRLNRDILNITGATLSVRAMNRGVRKVLGVLHEAYGI